MEHPIDMPGVLPFDRDALYTTDMSSVIEH